MQNLDRMSPTVQKVFNTDFVLTQVMEDLSGNPPIDFVELYTSDECQLKCTHCFHGTVRSIDKPLSLTEWIYVIDQFQELGAYHFHISGREPFLEKNTFPILHYLNKKKGSSRLKFGLITNGINCEKYLGKTICSNLDYFEISIDGLVESHEFLRGKGTYVRTVNTLKSALYTLGELVVSTSTIVYKNNLSELTYYIDDFIHLGVKRFFFQPIQKIGFAEKNYELLINPFEYRNAIIDIIDMLAAEKYNHVGVKAYFFVPSSMTKTLCNGDEFFLNILTKYLENGEIVHNEGMNTIQFAFELIRVPYWRNFIITQDGYLIDHCSTRSTFNYKQMSIGNVRSTSLTDLISKARQFSKEYVSYNLNLVK